MPELITTADELNKFVKARENTHNIFVSKTILFHNNGFGLTFSEVQLDGRTGKDANGDFIKDFRNEDFWSTDGGKSFTLTKHAMDKIATAAKIVFKNPYVAMREIDPDTKRVTYIKHVISWERLDLSGMAIQGTSSGEYSYYEDVNRFKFKENKYKWITDPRTGERVKTQEIVAKEGDPIMEQIERRRNFAGSLAETNAKVRAFAEAVSDIKKIYTAEEIAKPFLVPSVAVDVQGVLKNNPELEKMYNAKILGLAGLIYGNPVNNNVLVMNQPMNPNLISGVEIPPSIAKIENTKEPGFSDEEKAEIETKEMLVEEINKLITELNYKATTTPTTANKTEWLQKFKAHLEGLKAQKGGDNVKS